MNSQRPTDDELGGMTPNERLFVCGLLERWDAACFARDRDAMIQVLIEVAFSKDQAAGTAEAVLTNPKRYGF